MKTDPASRDFRGPWPSLDGASILVTGGTGSFGQQFVRHVLDEFKPKRVIVFSRDEQKQYEMALRLPPETHPAMRYFIGDVRDVDRLEMAMRGVDLVVHAAALKHVPAAEYNPFECIRTNVLGAENIVRAALRCEVKHVIALSTDKAANPVNLYGASKLASDKIFVAANNLSGAIGSRFAVVRYGNVFGSRGSVVPLFQRLIAEGGDSLPITDPAMTRFWITLSQGVNFVLSSVEMMQGGEIFVPKIPSMRVVDLARAMAPTLKHRIVGIRPGEKLHELMITEDDARNTVELSDRYIIAPSFHFGFEAEPWQDIGRPVPAGFSYTSDANPEWLEGEHLQRLLGTS
ncbi:MAG: UDP-N-acetylglucosamine 4,6-dehydratase (inverting) [Pseudorhodoplanes sp.]|nr:UDP-N-acetylglucosamine 4,6-dehydratase (inverting) [Pseudorhodoplanes sp.]GIK79316.1 MAG: UDP-N-acetylglucosamine 4,6-dehydratase (inverting) [Alphaproteobacteria bacterium]